MTFHVDAESITRNWRLGNKADKYANARRWRAALPAHRSLGKRDGSSQMIANAIYRANNEETPLRDGENAATDIVERLAHAYRYFYKLVEVDCQKARTARRQYGYSRFAVLWDLWLNYEFDIAERGFEYLELKMGNTALALFVVDAEDSVPEWKRRSTSIYRGAAKLLDDLDVPENLRSAARTYVDEYDIVFPKITKDIKRKI